MTINHTIRGILDTVGGPVVSFETVGVLPKVGEYVITDSVVMDGFGVVTSFVEGEGAGDSSHPS